MTPGAALSRGLGELSLTLPSDAEERLLAYVALLEKWNRTYNLTAIRNPEAMVTHHVLDSLAVIPALPPGSLVDVGAGAGLPGVPIAIAEPARQVTLNDANAKKGAFLRQVVIELRLANASVHVGRVEQWQPPSQFEIAICRGFAALAEFVTACRHLVLPGGVLAAMKGTFPAAELAHVPPGCNCRDVRKLHVPLLGAERHLVLCRMTD